MNRHLKFKLVILSFFLSGAAYTQNMKETSDSLLHYFQAKNYARAIPFAEQMLKIVKDRYGTTNKNYSSTLSLLAGLYFNNLELDKAERSFLELKEVNQKVFGTDSGEYIKGITLLAVVYNQTGDNRKTIPLLIESMQYYKTTSGDSSYEYASAANKLARVYEDFGDYEKALPLSETAAAITAKTKGVSSAEYATIINNQGLIQKNMGFPEKAEPLLLLAADIRKTIGGEKDPDYANSLNNLATLYTNLGQDVKAFDHYKRATAIYKQTKGETSFEYLTCLTNLGAAYDDLGMYQQAEAVYLEAQAIAGKQYDESWPLSQHISQKLGQLYLAMDSFDKAEPLVLKTVAAEKMKNDKSADHAAALNDLAYLYSHTNRYSASEQRYIESANITKEAKGSISQDYAITLNNLALLYQAQQRYEEAIAAMKTVTKIELDNFLKLFAVLSAAEKQNYIRRIEFVQNSNLSCLYKYPNAPASFYTDNYNTQLFLKSLLLTDSKNMLSSLRQTRDTALKSVFERWQQQKKELTYQYTLPESSRSSRLDILEKEAEEAEKELVRRSATFRDLREGLRVDVKGIQDKLKDDEAAIEFVNFQLVGNAMTDSMMYAALVLRKKDPVPLFVPLFEEKQLARIMGNNAGGSKTIVNHLYPGKNIKLASAASRQLYELLWKPLERSLQGIRKIRFAPAGRLNQVAFHAIAIDSNRLLMDEYELQQYVSTRDIVLGDVSTKKPSSAVLVGDPEFSTASVDGSGSWQSLRGTAKEVVDIKKQLDVNRVRTEIRMRKSASETAIKILDGRSPNLLYIATHGFFLPENRLANKSGTSYGRSVLSNSVNPLLRSGLVLAGGGNAWSGTVPAAGKEDGILTAYEVSQLNLASTDLVVLSACETGLGDIKGTEGVFGLQRAFKLAGVKKMIVSLWKVPDKETSELMIAVNKYWLQGKTLQASLAAARKEMQKKYQPFFWAAFVLVE